MDNFENEQFEFLDILVIICAYIQFDDHEKSRKEYKYLHNKLDNIESKINKILGGEISESNKKDS